MTEESRRLERSAGLFLFGLLALNYPLVSLFSTELMPFGIPLLYLYLFVCWLLLIVGIGRAIGGKPGDATTGERN